MTDTKVQQSENADNLPENAVAVHGLTKTYTARGSGKASGKQALKGIDLEIPRGSLFGLLGPNGAGKSTLINILAGLVIKSGGEAEVWGFDINRQARQARAAIGVVPQELNVDPFFTPRALLELQAGLYGVPPSERRTMALLATLGLADKAEAYARTLSGGMRRRLMVAKAMVHSPPVLVLDEPTAGVDVDLRQQLWAEVRRLNAGGVTVLLTTHYLEEAEELCDRIAIINHGSLIACDSTIGLLDRLDTKEVLVTLDRDLDGLPTALGDYRVEMVGRRSLRFQYQTSCSPLAGILATLSGLGLGIVDVSTSEPDLEDLFLQLTRS